MNLAAEIAAAHAKNEAVVATSIAAPRLELDPTRLQQFADFCKQYGVRALPAAPATVAAFAKAEYTRGTSADAILHTLQDIEAVHSNANLANPIATAAVRSVLSEILKLDPPRSWSRADRLVYATLPIEAQAIIERRAKEDSKAVRKAQADAAALKHQLEALQTKDISNAKESEGTE